MVSAVDVKLGIAPEVPWARGFLATPGNNRGRTGSKSQHRWKPDPRSEPYYAQMCPQSRAFRLLLEQDRYASRAQVCNGEIELPIAIEIRRRDCVRPIPNRIRRPRCLGEGPIAIPSRSPTGCGLPRRSVSQCFWNVLSAFLPFRALE